MKHMPQNHSDTSAKNYAVFTSTNSTKYSELSNPIKPYTKAFDNSIEHLQHPIQDDDSDSNSIVIAPKISQKNIVIEDAKYDRLKQVEEVLHHSQKRRKHMPEWLEESNQQSNWQWEVEDYHLSLNLLNANNKFDGQKVWENKL